MVINGENYLFVPDLNLTSVLNFNKNFEFEKIHTAKNFLKLFFLRNFTIEGIEPYLKYYLYKIGIIPQVNFGGYNIIFQELLDDDSKFKTISPDITVLSLIINDLSHDYASIGWKSDQLIEELSNIYKKCSAHSKSLIIINNFIPPFHSDYGITNTKNETDLYSEVIKVNHFIKNFVKNHCNQFILVDHDLISRKLGENSSIDFRFWFSSKALFKKHFLNNYAFEIAKTIRALRGKTKKCLILDCDNTLWGGIVGEDGINNIQLDKNNYPGNIYYSFQQNILNLYHKGVIIALCSKNNEGDVLEVLEKHPNCLLKKTHFSSRRINWDNKPSNIISIAQELNISVESMVFIDDNIVECEMVSKMVPSITVLQVPQDIHLLPSMLFQHGLFETLSLSEEDTQRTNMYLNEKLRIQSSDKFNSIQEYLESLEISIKININNEKESLRISQLTQKTNQFNLTTRRYSEIEISNKIKDKSFLVFSLTVSDKFGNLGLTGVFIAQNLNEKAIVDTFLLSCRILGRRVESVFADFCLNKIVTIWKIQLIESEYIKTEKNSQVANFWPQIGFKKLHLDNGTNLFHLEINSKKEIINNYIKINE